MSDAPELPEAKDPFERTIAVSIAIMAVILAYISMRGDNAKADSLRFTSEKSNKWAQYQAKSIKKNITQLELKLAKNLGATDIDQQTIRDEIKRYDTDEKKISDEAKGFESEASQGAAINDRCDYGALGLQIGIVLASVAILAREKLLWMLSLLLATVGAVVGISSFFM